MEFVICNREMAKYILPDKPYVRMSFINPNAETMYVVENDNCLGKVQLRFDDIDIANIPGTVLFNVNHAKNLIFFMEQHFNKAEVVVINCEAGLSRSAGAAAAFAKIYNGTDTDVIRKKPLYNRHIYSTIINEYYKMFQKNLDNLTKRDYND